MRIGFLLLPRFQMLAYVLATETFRIANKVLGEECYQWTSFSADDQSVAASNGAVIQPDARLTGAKDLRLMLVCAGYEPEAGMTDPAAALLRRLSRHGTALGGLDTGTAILASLGLLTGYRAVIHHEAAAGLRETWPEVQLSDAIYCIDRDRLTAAGGTATADLLLAWLSSEGPPGLAEALSTAMVHGRTRPMEERQRPTPIADSLVREAWTILVEELETPPSAADVSARLGTSPQTLSRRFKAALGQTPQTFLLGLRLDRARDLLATTDMAVTEIATASGFSSPAWFHDAYKTRFGLPPGRHRKLLR